MTKSGVKFDQGKRRASLVPWEVYLAAGSPPGLVNALRAWQTDGDRELEMTLYAEWLRADPNTLNEATKVLEFGARKYCENGWRSVPNAVSRYRDALWRHEQKRLLLLEREDDESGLPHSAHSACNALFLFALLGESDE